MILESLFMLASEIIKKINEIIPESLALRGDNVGYIGANPEETDIFKIKIVMDITQNQTNHNETNELIISHHPPLFVPESPNSGVRQGYEFLKIVWGSTGCRNCCCKFIRIFQ